MSEIIQHEEGATRAPLHTDVRLRVNVRINIVRQYDLDSIDDLTYALARDGYDREDYDILSVEEAI